jgi:hypothetical protein
MFADVMSKSFKSRMDQSTGSKSHVGNFITSLLASSVSSWCPFQLDVATDLELELHHPFHTKRFAVAASC